MTYQEKERIRSREYYHNNKEKEKLRKEKYYKKNKSRLDKIHGEYNKTHKHIVAKYYMRNREHRLEYGKQYDQNHRLKVIESYGGKCVWCGIDNPIFLTIDHINNDGAKHRKEMRSNRKIYRWLIKNNFPKDNFQLLCMNCNWAKGKYGYKPEQKDQYNDLLVYNSI